MFVSFSALAGVSALANPAISRVASSRLTARFSTMATMSTKDIVDTAVGAGSFGTLVAAVGAAGLVDTLKSSGPFTVFAPTDAAFAALPAGTVENLLKPENKDQLVAILTYHVLSGKVMAETAVTLGGKEVATVNGKSLMVTVAGGGVKVDAANVVTTDIECSNGVIHVIDAVIIPK
ncbi:immunogenic protein MPT70 [Pavlovales sp. CCMP2436]|nr:immunogenic protein MPT70 [Pavlovales sp. CCMP2436]